MQTGSRGAANRSLIAAVAVALGVVIVVGLAAGAPDRTTDLADPEHLGPRLVILALGLTVLVGLELLALSSNRWWVRVLALPLGLLLAALLIALLEDSPSGTPVAGESASGGLGSNHLVVRVVPAAGIPMVASDVVGVDNGEGIRTYALPPEGWEPVPPEAVRDLVSILDLHGTPGLGVDDPGGDSALSGFVATAAGEQEAASEPLGNDDLVAVVHGQGESAVEVDIPTVVSGPLPEDTVDRLVGAAHRLARAGYEVDLVLPAEPIHETRPSSGWNSLRDDVLDLLASLRWLAIPVLLALTGLLVAGFARARGRGGRRPDPLPIPETEVDADAARAGVAAALDQALDELPLEGDPRSVIAAAYLRMAAALADHGVERRPSDTPLEYLARALEQLDASTHAIRRLTDLLQVAMFSARPVGPEMADEAIDAFTQVRDELRSPAWV